jgi:VWFA-related protein
MFKAIIKVLPFSILVAASCLAQNPAQQPQTPPDQNLQVPAKPDQTSAALKIKTRLVIVDVVARDSKGLAVTDLKQEDFTILEDGKEQKLRIFNFQQPGSAAGRPRTLPAAAGNMVDNLPHFESPRALNVILMDALNTSRSNQMAARDAMIRFLEKLPENEPIAVYLLGDKLRLLQDFTTDPAVLKEVVRSFKGKNSLYLNSSDASTIGPILPGISQALLPQMAAQIREFQVQSAVSVMDQRVQLTLSALDSLARTLSGYPGRKNLLWFSEAFPLDLLLSDAAGRSSSLNDRHYMHDVARTGHLLSDSQVAIYPVDAAGLTGLPMLDPANGGNSMANGRIAARDLFGGHSTMNDLAERTGGRAFYDRNDLENAVHESIDDGSTYYTLGYYPENKNWNGSFRKIQIKLHRGAVKLRYRIGYFAADNAIFAKLAPKKQDEDFDQALTLNFPISTALPFKAIVLPPSAQTANKVVVNFGADPHALTFTETTDGLQQVNMECAVRVFARKNPDKALSTEARKMGGALNPEAYGKVMKGFFPCQSQVDLQPGDYILRLGVRDNETGLIGTTNAALTIRQQNSAPGSKAENKP